jgi:subtilisin family serine protease
MTPDDIRIYVVLRANERLRALYESRNRKALLKYISESLPQPERGFFGSFEVTALPSGAINLHPQKRRHRAERRPDELVVGLVAKDIARDEKSSADLLEEIRKRKEVFVGCGADLPFAGVEHWCPSDAASPIFADRRAAEGLVRAPYLADQGLTGDGVNVVVVDQGLDQARLGPSYADGWTVGVSVPGTPHNGPDQPHGGHGMMVARNILSVAPNVKLFDLPLLPPRIGNIQDFFLNRADAAYRTMLDGIAEFKSSGEYPGPWLLVNAWAIYDRRTESPAGDYTNNRNHHFHDLIDEAVSAGIDVVFAAGNCGQFCPDARCGVRDNGPGNSIFGVNSYDTVLTVGAVRADAMWLGYSSQGPGQPQLDRAKPDLCASSQFREVHDAFTVNTGTSASAALAAGVVAALRSNWDSSEVTPHRLKEILNETARPGDGAGARERYGNGVLDAAKAYDALLSE